MTTPEFISLNDGDVIGIRHIVIITFVGGVGDTDKRCELILSNGAKKKISVREGEHIRSALINECLLVTV
jgi:hypothetical protein